MYIWMLTMRDFPFNDPLCAPHWYKMYDVENMHFPSQRGFPECHAQWKEFQKNQCQGKSIKCSKSFSCSISCTSEKVCRAGRAPVGNSEPPWCQLPLFPHIPESSPECVWAHLKVWICFNVEDHASIIPKYLCLLQQIAVTHFTADPHTVIFCVRGWKDF